MNGQQYCIHYSVFQEISPVVFYEALSSIGRLTNDDEYKLPPRGTTANLGGQRGINIARLSTVR